MTHVHTALAALALAALTLATVTACSDRARTGGDDVTVRVDGSSTVYPISEAIAEQVGKEATRDKDGARITIGVSGTAGGFEKLCDAEIHVAAASRPILTKELEQCAAKGVAFIEVPIAFDGIAIVVHPDNTWATTMTIAELKKLWEPAAQGKVMRWRDVRADWPDHEIHLFGAGVDSGTFDYFTQAIVGRENASRGDFTSSEDDNVLVNGVKNDKLALGFFGLAYAHANASALRVVAIDADNGKGPVAASPITVLDGTYQPLSRPLFLYVDKSAAERPEVRAFVEGFLADPKIIEEVGYVPLPAHVRELARKRVAGGVVGSMFGGRAHVGVRIEHVLSDATFGAP